MIIIYDTALCSEWFGSMTSPLASSGPSGVATLFAGGSRNNAKLKSGLDALKPSKTKLIILTRGGALSSTFPSRTFSKLSNGSKIFVISIKIRNDVQLIVISGDFRVACNVTLKSSMENGNKFILANLNCLNVFLRTNFTANVIIIPSRGPRR